MDGNYNRAETGHDSMGKNRNNLAVSTYEKQ